MRTHLHKFGIGDRKREGDEKENDDAFDGSEYGRCYAGWAATLHL